MRRHLKISSGAVVVMRETQWRTLMERINGHVAIGAGARVVIVPDRAAVDWEKLARPRERERI